MITNEEKAKYNKKSQVTLDKIKSSIKRHVDNKNVAGPFYVDGCVIYCNKEKVKEVKEKYNIQ